MLLKIQRKLVFDIYFMLINSIDHFLVFWLGLVLLLLGVEINFANILFHVFINIYFPLSENIQSAYLIR